jgi:hypothetical protein
MNKPTTRIGTEYLCEVCCFGYNSPVFGCIEQPYVDGPVAETI